MKERTRRIDANASRESDSVIVPEKQPNRETPVSTEAVEERTLAKRNVGDDVTSRTQSRNMVSFGLEGVRTRAKTDKTCCCKALLHHITPELLRQSFYELNRKAAPGIDRVTWQEYEKQLEERLPNLHTEIHKGSYRAKPVLRAKHTASAPAFSRASSVSTAPWISVPSKKPHPERRTPIFFIEP